jgi:glutaredoxin 3
MSLRGAKRRSNLAETRAEQELQSPMAKVEMYATGWCPYCARARALLERKGVAFTEIDIDEEPRRRDEMIRRARRTSVPQIFIDGEHIGGSDELAALDRAGKLDPKLGIAR